MSPVAGPRLAVPLVVHQLGSGSGGNATLVCGPAGAVLVDAGFSARELRARARLAGVDLAAVRGIVLTHGHVDHLRGASVLARQLGVPIWATPATLRQRVHFPGGEELRPLPLRGAIELAGMPVETLPVSHDAPQTVILRIAGRLGVATDLGEAGPEVAAFLSGLDGLLLEFNHDRALLEAGRDPPWLKERILSARGHLSNAQAAALLAGPAFERPRQALWLAHLSQRNNLPLVALATAREAMDGMSAAVLLTEQERAARPFTLLA